MNMPCNAKKSSEPVVTKWDKDLPGITGRPVGTWDVTPTASGVAVLGAGRGAVPEEVKD